MYKTARSRDYTPHSWLCRPGLIYNTSQEIPLVGAFSISPWTLNVEVRVQRLCHDTLCTGGDEMLCGDAERE